MLLTLDIFGTYGNPEVMISDNDPPLKSEAVKYYMLKKGVKHRRITPLRHQPNAKIEKFMLSLKKIVQAYFIDRINRKRETS